MTGEKLIELRGIDADYGERQILREASLTIYERDFLGIIGPNGGGKTTLLKIILGLLKPRRGSVMFFRGGKQVDNLRIGYLPQYSTFDKKFPISVYDVILSGLHSRKTVIHRFSHADHEKAKQLLEMLNLKDVGHQTIGELSGGQRQRVLIGRALICDPEVLILDEPNTYIDQQNQEKLYDLLAKLNAHYAIVIVSHDIGTVLRSVRNIACVNGQVHYHPASEVDGDVLEKSFGCPFELIAHGHVPHRILEDHTD